MQLLSVEVTASANIYSFKKNHSMKKYLSCFLSVFLLLACSEQQESISSNNEPEVVKLSNQDAQKSFAKLLSKAVYNSADIRSFLKKEALEQFDNDYDVFLSFRKKQNRIEWTNVQRDFVIVLRK